MYNNNEVGQNLTKRRLFYEKDTVSGRFDNRYGEIERK